MGGGPYCPCACFDTGLTRTCCWGGRSASRHAPGRSGRGGGVGGATACFYFGCMAIPGKVLAWERRSRAAHLLILDDKVQGDGHGKAPEGNIQRSPSRESEAQVVILLVLRPLLNCRVAVTRAPKGCERVGEGREAHMRGVRVERGRCSRTPAQRISRCTTITTTKTHLLGLEGSCGGRKRGPQGAQYSVLKTLMNRSELLGISPARTSRSFLRLS